MKLNAAKLGKRNGLRRRLVKPNFQQSAGFIDCHSCPLDDNGSPRLSNYAGSLNNLRSSGPRRINSIRFRIGNRHECHKQDNMERAKGIQMESLTVD